MKTKTLLTPFLFYLSRYCLILGLALSILFQSCKREDPTPNPSPNAEGQLTVFVSAYKTMKPLSNVKVTINTRGGFIREGYTNDTGVVLFPISQLDSGWMKTTCEKNGYSVFRDSMHASGYISEQYIELCRFSYLRFHVLNQAPVSMSERINILNPKEYNFEGATDTTFIEQIDRHGQIINCGRYWNGTLDSLYGIPIFIIPEDTADITITF